MSAAAMPIRDLTDPERVAAITRAAEALRAGGLVVLPTETVYGLAGSAASGEALERMSALARDGGALLKHTWHAPSTDAVREVIPVESPVHDRVLERLTPGPVRLLFEVGEERAKGIATRLGALAGVIDHGADVAVRVPDHPVALAVLERAGVPVVAQRLAAFGWGSGRDVREAAEPASRAGVGVVLDDGPTRFGRPSATVRLTAAGGYAVVSEGAWDARTIDRRIERTVLFVCTGNTCRSPMAEAIARGVYEGGESPRVPTRFRSAGTGAAEGSAPTPEAVAVLGEMGFAPGQSRSRELTREMVRSADAVYGMTRGHVRAVLEIDPSAAGKVFTIDPAGEDVPDPIGGPPEVYRRTASRLLELIRQRFTGGAIGG